MESLKLDLSLIDYVCVFLYFVFVIAVGFYMKKKAEKDRSAFFLSGQNLPWWLLGTSMVATTFSIQTPLLVAGWARQAGVAKNWEWWVFLFGQMFTTFFFAKLWRRANVYNDAQFIYLRYSGRAASFLRGFRALYMGFIMNMVVIGTGLVAAGKFGTIILGIGPGHPNYRLWYWGIAIFGGLTALIYSTLSGFAAIVITDFVGFILAMIGGILVAVFVCLRPEVGGLSGMVAQIKELSPEKLEFFPSFDPARAAVMSLWAILLYSAVRWWAQVYGGAEPGGGSHVVQRLNSARSENHALLGSMLFNVAHYALRPLPWIIAGLASLLVFPIGQFTDHEKVYLACIDFAPAGLAGLIVASLFAAFLTTIDTRLNLGASYFVNDFYKPFVSRKRSERHYVFVSRAVTVAQLVLSYLVLFVAEDIKDLFFIYAGIGSGSGLVFILRFYWWRVSAWSEMTAMAAALILCVVFRFFVYGSAEAYNAHALEFMFISVAVVTVIWLVVTYATDPPSREKLKDFFRRVRPAGPFWKPISIELEQEEGIRPKYNLKAAFVGWIFSNPMTFGYLFGLGNLLLGRPYWGTGYLAMAVICTVITVKCLRKVAAAEA